MAYKIPTILTILATVFMDAWQLSAIAESGDQKTHLRFYGRVWDAFASAVLLGAGSIIAFSPLLIRLLADEPYYEAWQYIPLLTLSMAAAAFSNFMGSVYVVTKKSSVSFWTSLIGALINIGLNLWLIPRIGIQGANHCAQQRLRLQAALRSFSFARSAQGVCCPFPSPAGSWYWAFPRCWCRQRLFYFAGRAGSPRKRSL